MYTESATPENRFAGENRPQNNGIRNFLGYVLVIGATSITIWVFVTVYALFTQPERLTPFQSIVSSSDLETTITIAGKEGARVVVPTEFLSYGVALVLLMIAVSAASILMMGGTRLLDSDVRRLSRKLSAMSDRMARKMDRIKETLSHSK